MILSVKNLKKKFGKNIAVNGISFNVKENEIFGLLGSNGAGKTTTIKILTGLLKPNSGEVNIFGMNLRKNLYKIREKIGLVPQTVSIYEDLSVYNNLKFFGSLYIKNSRDREEKIEEIIKTFRLGKPEKLGKELSGGYKRRLSIGIALINNPNLLFLDEPTTGIDIVTNKLVLNFIKKKKKNSSIILTTHSIKEAENICDRIGIMHQGKMLIKGEVEDLIKEQSKKHGEKIIVDLKTKENAEKEYSRIKSKGVDIKGSKIIFRIGIENMKRVPEIINHIKSKSKIEDISIEKPSLEELFSELIS
jgi:ABC-2 type transport system ATP-binding protein